MKHTLLTCLLLMSMALSGRAQERLISDTVVFPETFAGYIGYRIEYSGKLSHEQKHWLPDSMLVIAKYPIIRIRYFGGLAPQLLNDLYWNCEFGNYLLIDRYNKLTYTPPANYRQAPAKLNRPDGKQTIAGVPCLTYNIVSSNGKMRVWASDSIFFPINVQDSVPQLRPVFFQANLASIPLKTEYSHAGILITTTATQVVPTLLPDEEFQLPSGYPRATFEGRMSRHPAIGKK